MKREGVQKVWDKYKYVILVVLAGVVLLLLPSGEKESGEDSGSSQTAFPDGAELEERMERLLAQIDGVGEVRVMLTVETDGERLLAQDGEVSCRGPAPAQEEYERKSETVRVNSGSGKGDEVVILQSRSPTYRGALVVCSGGDRAEVKLTVTQAVMALTGLSADRVTVAKWQ